MIPRKDSWINWWSRNLISQFWKLSAFRITFSYFHLNVSCSSGREVSECGWIFIIVDHSSFITWRSQVRIQGVLENIFISNGNVGLHFCLFRKESSMSGFQKAYGTIYESIPEIYKKQSLLDLFLRDVLYQS